MKFFGCPQEIDQNSLGNSSEFLEEPFGNSLWKSFLEIFRRSIEILDEIHWASGPTLEILWKF